VVEQSSPSPDEVRVYVEALEDALVGIHGFVCGALAREEPWEDDGAREAFVHIQALVERVLPEVIKIRAMMEEADDEPPVVH
jgi:hypothetical protein